MLANRIKLIGDSHDDCLTRSFQMISDIGGNLGLLLGASAFTLYEFLEDFVRRCLRRGRRAVGRVASADLLEVISRESAAIGDLEKPFPTLGNDTFQTISVLHGEGDMGRSIQRMHVK